MIYVVTSGAYSDYAINAVFSTEEKAKQYIEMKNSSGEVDHHSLSHDHDHDYSIEEYGVDSEWIFIPRTSTVYSVQIKLDDGSLVKAAEGQREKGVTLSKPYVSYDGTAYALSQKSKKHALKLAAELRQEWLRSQGILRAEVAASMEGVGIMDAANLQHFDIEREDDGSIVFTAKQT